LNSEETKWSRFNTSVPGRILGAILGLLYWGSGLLLVGWLKDINGSLAIGAGVVWLLGFLAWSIFADFYMRLKRGDFDNGGPNSGI